MTHVLITGSSTMLDKNDIFFRLCEDILFNDWNLQPNNITLILLNDTDNLANTINTRMNQTHNIHLEYHKTSEQSDIVNTTTINHTTTTKKHNKIYQICNKLILFDDNTNNHFWTKINGSKYY